MTTEMPHRMHLNGYYTEEEKDKFKPFAQYFGSVFSKSSSSTPVFHYNINDSIGSLCITMEDIRLTLLKLDISKGAGPDNITPSILMFCGGFLSKPLHHLSIEFWHQVFSSSV